MSARTPARRKASTPKTPKASAQPLAATLRAKFGLTRPTFARLIGFSERVIADWEGGKAMSQPGMRRVWEIDRLRDALARVIRPEAITGWLEIPNKAFDGLKPLEVVERGEVDRLWKMIIELEAGMAS